MFSRKFIVSVYISKIFVYVSPLQFPRQDFFRKNSVFNDSPEVDKVTRWLKGWYYVIKPQNFYKIR